MTEYEQQLYPYVQQVKQEHERKFNLWQPIEFVFDLLSRGQYMTANTAKQFITNLKSGQPIFYGVPREIWQGLSGQEKGDWGTVLWGGQDVGGEKFQGLFPGAGQQLEKSWWGRRAKGAAALAANILLDPTTYIGFGPTGGAKGVARAYAKNAVKLEFADLAGRIAKGEVTDVSQEAIEKVLQSFVQKNKRIAVEQLVGKDWNKYMTRFYNRAYKEGLRLPAQTLRANQLSKAKEILERMPQEIKNEFYINKSFVQGGADISKLAGGLAPTGDLPTLLRHLENPQTYTGAGTRTVRFMRKEMFKGERYPSAVRMWDRAIEKIRSSKIGGVFSNAYWAVMDNPKSPVAQLKKLFNVRNPYQQMLANLSHDATAVTPLLRERYMQGWLKATEGLDEHTKQIVHNIRLDMQNGIDMAEAIKSYGLKGPELAKVQQAIPKIDMLMESMVKRYNDLVSKDPSLGKLIPDVEHYSRLAVEPEAVNIYNMPGTQLGEPKPSFARTRETTHFQQMSRERAIWQMLGVTPEDAERLVRSGATQVYQMNPDRIFATRAFAQARFEQRAALIQQMREFGVNVNQLPEDVRGLVEQGLPRMGLVRIEDPALAGYLFDSNVGEIFKRVTSIAQNDNALAGYEKLLEQYTSWWRAWATLSPGFHLRNAYSNNFTLFMKYGMTMFDPNKQLESVVGTIYGLYGEGAVAAAKKIGISEDAFRQVLNKKVGNNTIAELAEVMRARNVISRRTMGIDIPTDVESLVKMNKFNWNPLSRQFAPFKGSHEVGALIESQPRFLSALLDIDNAAKVGSAGEDAIDYAVYEAKKWFIDYGDLSPFEQKVMRKIVPFYTWLRKNVANQLTGMLEFKEMYSIVPKTLKAAKGGEVTSMPEYMKQAGYIPLWDDYKKGIVRMLWPNLPYADLNLLPVKFEQLEGGGIKPIIQPAELLADVLQSAHPIIKNMVEVVPALLGGEAYDTFLRQTLGKTQKVELGPLSRMLFSNPQVVQFLDGFLHNIGVKEGLQPKIDDRGRLTMSSPIAKLLDTNVMFLRKIQQFMDAPEYLIEAVRSAREKSSDEKDELARAEKGLQVLSFYFGVKMRNLDEISTSEREASDIFKEAEQKLIEARKQLPGYQQRSMVAIQRQLFRQKKLGAFR